ncbi:CDP-glycerol glycerophosphotransferase family protein [Halomonas chromatireducens]|uniref:CDP-Glycerol:Poly(Glycerophosphate) glycerophosphotransferase n=1 Tax=Halomonas chromatireducens TaxID=507626 RepID=A0A109UL87_9GAMM|nr:CDP-glycerol glycerophosphotransferase family protein [Halomonas chromatireducens]AMD00097.1 CDP-Glycerol:Poly(glycerophosphate) glycerophosphotransferase [Halomonas chromatireducens]
MMAGGLILSLASRLWRRFYQRDNDGWVKKQALLAGRYEKIRERLVLNIADGKKIRVLFLVRENQKWGAQSLYEELEKDIAFEPVVVVAPLKQLGRSVGKTQLLQLGENYSFFKNKNMNVELGYDQGRKCFIPLKTFFPDVVFYDQPYGLSYSHRIEVVSRYALTCYIPYGYGLYLARESGQLSSNFFPLIWRVYLESRGLLNGWDDSPIVEYGNYIYLGYPKMDALLSQLPRSRHAGSRMGESVSSEKVVVFAPHHSLESGHHNQYATFPWSGEDVLELARGTPQFRWVFKPHPRLKYTLVKSGTMKADEVEKYYKSWRMLPNAEIVDDGDYLEILKHSDAMITDCGSFLLEYLITGKPLIHLVNSDSQGYSSFGEEVVRNFYKAVDGESLSVLFERVVVNGDDFLYEERIRNVCLPSGVAGREIKDDLKRAILAV